MGETLAPLATQPDIINSVNTMGGNGEQRTSV